jgi:hypothetical protein
MNYADVCKLSRLAPPPPASCLLWLWLAVLVLGGGAGGLGSYRLLAPPGFPPVARRHVHRSLRWEVYHVPSYSTLLGITTGDSFQRCLTSPGRECFATMSLFCPSGRSLKFFSAVRFALSRLLFEVRTICSKYMIKSIRFLFGQTTRCK